MAKALLSLGSNVGDRAASLERALTLLEQTPGVRVVARSSFHETRPAGGPAGQENFLNAAAIVETELPPQSLFSILQAVEDELGRVRDVRWCQRTIDLDLLLYDQQVLKTPELTIPHLRMSFRRFVLEPAAEIAPDMVHPTCGTTIEGLLRHLDQSPRFLAIAGLNAAVVSALKRDPKLLFAWEEGRSGCSVEDPSKLIEAVHRLEHDQWLIGTVWGASDARFVLDESGHVGQPPSIPHALMQPKLLVVLRNAELAGRKGALLARICDSYHGPVLWLKDASPALVAEEVLAAIEAME